MTKQEQAQEIANVLEQAAKLCAKASELMEQNDLNLENYPENWNDFNEHAGELRNIFVTDFADIQVQVG